MAAEKITGEVMFLKAHEGSKSEAVMPYLYRGKENGVTPIFLKGDNPFENPGLTAYDGKTVELTGTYVNEAFEAESVKQL